ncbi:MAG: superoxide dismutase [Desulfobacca sp. RBG_16_58_9]|nr:MAG: superoxide dismutase [Desulfobacca sp. RBG_16_58_9]
MAYVAKDFAFLLGMPGFSDTLLKNHFTLYQGYVNNTNKVMELLAGMVKAGQEGTPEFAELKRRLGWEFNGMRLHELYFGNLGGDGDMAKAPNLMQKKAEQFGDVATCAKDFKATAAMRGIGWVIMYQDIESGLLFNQWINEHDGGHPAGGNPILVLDVFEHAFITDYGLKRADYLEAFFKNVKWDLVEKRLR